MHELQVLLRQHSADIIARVERDLTTHVQGVRSGCAATSESCFNLSIPRKPVAPLAPFSKAFSWKK